MTDNQSGAQSAARQPDAGLGLHAELAQREAQTWKATLGAELEKFGFGISFSPWEAALVARLYCEGVSAEDTAAELMNGRIDRFNARGVK